MKLTEGEVTALLQVGLKARVSEEYKRVLQRLFHRGLVNETAEGLKLTQAGKALFNIAARQQGLVKP